MWTVDPAGIGTPAISVSTATDAVQTLRRRLDPEDLLDEVVDRGRVGLQALEQVRLAGAGSQIPEVMANVVVSLPPM